jgi:hypothetical protein
MPETKLIETDLIQASLADGHYGAGKTADDIRYLLNVIAELKIEVDEWSKHHASWLNGGPRPPSAREPLTAAERADIVRRAESIAAALEEGSIAVDTDLASARALIALGVQVLDLRYSHTPDELRAECEEIISYPERRMRASLCSHGRPEAECGEDE